MKKIIIFVVSLFVCSCSTTGNRSLVSNIPVLIPSSTEVQLGQQVTLQVLQEYRLCSDKTINDYVNNLGQKIVSFCDRQDIPYSFYVLQTNMINAFAAPGGAIFVTTGILKFMDNEAQLAGVLGHELGHVTARHSMKALELQIGYQVLADLFFGTNADQAMLKQVAGAGVGLLFMRHSRDQEYEADMLGTKYAFKTGYEPLEMATFLGKLAALEGGGRQVEFLSTHPLSDKRMAEVKSFCTNLTLSPGAPPLELGITRFTAMKKLVR